VNGYFIAQISLSCNTNDVVLLDETPNYIFSVQLYTINSTEFKRLNPH